MSDGNNAKHGDKNNNRWVNLRFVTQQENCVNKMRGPMYGITRKNKGFWILFTRRRKPRLFGVARTLEEAILIRDKTVDILNKEMRPGGGHERGP